MKEQRTVLVADDDPDIRQLVRLRLERSGYTVLSANDGTAALGLATDCSPDIAVLDVAMPGLSGLEVTRALRDRQATFPVILLTARAGDVDVINGEAAGADAYITKPFSPQELELRIAEILGG